MAPAKAPAAISVTSSDLSFGTPNSRAAPRPHASCITRHAIIASPVRSLAPPSGSPLNGSVMVPPRGRHLRRGRSAAPVFLTFADGNAPHITRIR